MHITYLYIILCCWFWFSVISIYLILSIFIYRAIYSLPCKLFYLLWYLWCINKYRYPVTTHTDHNSYQQLHNLSNDLKYQQNMKLRYQRATHQGIHHDIRSHLKIGKWNSVHVLPIGLLTSDNQHIPPNNKLTTDRIKTQVFHVSTNDVVNYFYRIDHFSVL
jgi:hypothetical protein